MKFRKLRSNEIDVRVGSVGAKGVTLLLYKDARVDMQILDDTVGPENWQRDHFELKGNLFCRVGIKCGDTWVWKADCGTESNTEKEKGESSDSFKRACVCWGIGRELYTAPLIFVPCETEAQGTGYKLKNRNEFFGCRVTDITYYTEDGAHVIDGLTIRNRRDEVIYSRRAIKQ